MRKVALTAVIILLVLVVISLMFFRHTPFSYSGVIEAVEIDVPARLGDVIVKLNAEEGLEVKSGDILAELECKETLLREDISKKEFIRAESMYKTNAGSKENFDLKKNQYDQALLAKSWCKIASPINGKVLYKYYEEGEFIAMGRKIVTVSDLKRVDAWVYVEHDLLANLSVGQKVTGTLPEVNMHFEGTILTVNDEAEFTPKNVQTKKERERLVFGVKTRFQNDDALTLKPGMTLEIKFNR